MKRLATHRVTCAVFVLVGLLVGLPGGSSAGTSAAAAEGDAEGPRATLTWKSKDDKGLYGYLVYRATKREGPYRRVGREIVHVVPPDDEGLSNYAFVDRDVVAGRTYFYYLDTLDANGRKKRFSGVVAKTVAER